MEGPGWNPFVRGRTALRFATLAAYQAHGKTNLLHCDREAHETDLQVFLQTNFFSKESEFDAFAPVVG